MAATAAIATVAQAQINFYIVDKQQNFTQTGFSSPTLVVSNPFSFTFEINGAVPGTGIGTIVNHAVTLPGGGGTYTLVGGDYDAPSDRWQFRQTFALKSAMDAAFPNGTYSVDVGSQLGIPLTLNSSVPGDLYPGSAPQLLSATNGATWNGSGQLLINATAGSLLTFAPFSEYGGTLNGQVGAHMGATLMSTSGPFFETGQEAFILNADLPNADPSFTTFNIASLVSGQTYKFEMEYNVLTTADGASISGATGVALFTTRLQFDILAVPEPSTYAAILGGVALVGAMIRRRRLA